MLKRMTKKVAAKLPSALQRELKRFSFGRSIRRGTFIPAEPEMRVISEHVHSGDWLIDVGANIGHYTCHMSACAGPSGRVFAFEPLLDSFALLTANVQAARLSNVTLINAAASNATSEAHMTVPKFDTGLENLYRAFITNKGEHSILCFSLDTIPILRQVSLIKIDAEGHDLQVLRGAERLINEARPVLIVEASEKGEIAEWIRDHGYKIDKVDHQSPNIVARPIIAASETWR